MWKHAHDEVPSNDREILLYHQEGWDKNYYSLGMYIREHTYLYDDYIEKESTLEPYEADDGTEWVPEGYYYFFSYSDDLLRPADYVLYWMDFPKLPEAK